MNNVNREEDGFTRARVLSLHICSPVSLNVYKGVINTKYELVDHNNDKRFGMFLVITRPRQDVNLITE